MRARSTPAILLFLGLYAAAGAAEIGIGGRATAGGKPVRDGEVLLLRAQDPVTAARRDLAGAEREPIARGKTGPDGFFDIVAPDAGLYTLRIAAPGLVPVVYSLAPLLEPVELPDAELVADSGLTIRVLGADGKALPRATVRVAEPRSRFRGDEGSWKIATRLVSTSDDGSVRVPRGENENLVISVGAPGFLAQERRSVRGTSTTFRLEAGTAVPILARSADGAPIEGALVTAAENDHPLGLTDASGAARLTVPRGGLRIALATPGGAHAEGTVLVPKPGSEPRKFVVPTLRPVAGRVIDAETRRAIPGAWAFRSDEPWAAVPCDANGAYSLPVAPKGATGVVAGATGYLGGEPINVLADSTETAGPTLALRPAAAIEGTVVDAAGKPVGGARVKLETKRSGNTFMVVMGRPTGSPSATSSSRGRFRMSGIDPSKAYDLEARAAGYAPATREILGLEPRKTVQGVRVELDAGQRVVGRVTDGAGQPLRDAEVSLKAAARDRAMGGMIVMGEGSKTEAATGTTDADGRFSIGGLRAGVLDLTARRKGFAKKTVSGIDVKAGSEPVDVGDLALVPGERLLGVVSDPDGRPIEGVQVSISEAAEKGPMFMMAGAASSSRNADAVTGPDGLFTLDDLLKDQALSLSFSRQGYLERSETGAKAPSAEPLQVTLEPSSKVSGRVVDRDKKPIPGADVALAREKSGGIGGAVVRMMRRENRTTDDAGAFVFDGVEPGTISLQGSGSGWQEAKLDAIEVPKGSDLDGVEIVLTPGAVVTGRVLAPDGRPAIGAAVALVSETDRPFRFRGPVTDGDGRYRLDGIEPGKVSIEVTHEDYVRTVKELDARAGMNVLNLQLEGGSDVAGLLVDSSGSAVAGGWIRLAAPGRDFGGPETTSAPDGSFKFAGVGDGDYAVWAGRKGLATSEGAMSVKVEGQPVSGLRVELGRAGAVTGTISGIDPERLPQVTVRALGEGPFGGAGVDRQGRYRLEDLSPGRWTVVASLEATGEQARGEVVLEPDAPEARLDLEFGHGLTLSGRALHGDAPVKGAALFAEGVDVNHSGSGRTGPDGKFAIQGLEPGTYRLDLRQWESGLSFSDTFEVKQSREVTLDIPSAVAAGVVVDSADRQPLSGVTLTLSPGSSGDSSLPGFLSERGATTDLNGRFRIPDLKDGEWRLSASRKGYAAGARSVVVQSGRGAEDLRLELDPTEGLTLEVRLPSGRVPEEISAAVLDPSGRPLQRGRFATGENGKVRLSSVPAGSWDVLLSAGGSGTANVRVAAPGGPLPVSLPPACGLRVTVPDLGGSDVAASATVLGADGKPFRSLAWFSDPVSVWRLRRGEVEFDSLPPGSWTIQVSAADGRTWQGTAATTPGEQATAVLR